MAKAQEVAVAAPVNSELDSSDVVGTIEDLTKLEKIVETGLDSFMAVGGALAEISERKLYKLEGFTDFENYARTRWNLDRSFAYKQIRASEAVKVLAEHFDTTQLPKNEAQAREITVLAKNPEQQVEAWGLALEAAEKQGSALPTAAQVREAVKEIKAADQLESEDEPDEDDPVKAYQRAVKGFPKVWNKLEETFEALKEMPIRAISSVSITDQDANITEHDIQSLAADIADWYESYLVDVADFKERRRLQREKMRAAKEGKAKNAGSTHGKNGASEVEAEMLEAETAGV